MSRRDRLRGLRFPVGACTAEVRRSCRNELKVIYEARCVAGTDWEALARLGAASYVRASQINPAMKDLVRITCPGALLEGAVGGSYVIAIYRGSGRLGARHAVERILRERIGVAPSGLRSSGLARDEAQP